MINYEQEYKKLLLVLTDPMEHAPPEALRAAVEDLLGPNLAEGLKARRVRQFAKAIQVFASKL